MKKFFYPRLAFDGIRKNKRLYLPYILTQIGMIMMYYIVIFLRYGESLKGTFGEGTVSIVLMLGGWVIAIFACIFLFYTNSFLIRRRKKEFGLYNILGMDKKNISILLFWESLITSAISLFCGLVLGVALSKLAELGLVKAIGGTDISYVFHVSPTAILLTAGVFAVIFLLLFINSVRQIMGASAVTLIRSENLGEKPPKANPLLGIIGAVLLIGAYITAVVITEPLSAILVFFIAVIMVIIGTYLLMIFGSVLLCRFLQKRKTYYYKPNHFISVSSMTYRMKRNGAGLASVCVLATMVLVMISSTTCLLFGTEDSINTRYPRDIVLSTGFDTIDGLDDGNIEKVGEVFFTVGPLLIPNPGLPVFPGHDPKVYHPVKESFPVGAFPGDRTFFLQILRQFHQHFHSTAAFPVIWFYCTAKFSFPQWTRREICIKRDLFNIEVSFSFNPYSSPA